MKKMTIILLLFTLSSCGENYGDLFSDSGTANQCVENVLSDAGKLAGSEIVYYNNQGCCEYEGGVSNFSSCSGVIICKSGQASNCSR